MESIDVSITMQPIGYFRCSQSNKYDQPRQAALAKNCGRVEIAAQRGLEQTLVGLQKGDWIWLLFCFHRNKNWKPMVKPPRGTQGKIGVLATRAPYRPNPLGMSVVQIENIDGLNIEVKNHDLLDGSPILDIKPYLSLSDSMIGIEPSWLDSEEMYQVSWQPLAKRKSEFLEKSQVPIRVFVEYQLQFNPVDSQRKRVIRQGEGYLLSYRTWRVYFQIEQGNKIEVIDIYSGYQLEELAQSHQDPWEDKTLHSEFVREIWW